MDTPLSDLPGHEQHRGLHPLDRRMTVVETRLAIESESRSRFEENILARFDTLNKQLADIQEQRALGKGALRGIVLTLSFLGSTTGTGVLLLLKLLLGWGAS